MDDIEIMMQDANNLDHTASVYARRSDGRIFAARLRDAAREMRAAAKAMATRYGEEL